MGDSPAIRRAIQLVPMRKLTVFKLAPARKVIPSSVAKGKPMGEPNKVDIVCPRCRKQLTAPADMIGRAARCPDAFCGARIEVCAQPERGSEAMESDEDFFGSPPRQGDWAGGLSRSTTESATELEVSAQTQVTCPGCSAAFRSKPEWAGPRVKCPKCYVPFSVPHTACDGEDDSDTSALPRWLIFLAVSLVAVAVGASGGFVFGHRQSRSDDKRDLTEAQARSKRELAESQARAQSLTEQFRAAEASVVKMQTERDTFKLDLAAAIQDRDTKLIASRRREEEASRRAREAEQKLAATVAAEAAAAERKREDDARKAEAWKKVETVQVSTVRKALKIHENPKEYVGKKIVVSQDIAMVIGDNFRRNSESNGYLFSWKCGATARGAEDLGNGFGLQAGKLNYWCDTDSGITAKEKLKAERSGDSIYYNRVGLTFNIKSKTIKEFGGEREYYIAELIGIESK